jgi:hypothetical protein
MPTILLDTVVAFILVGEAVILSLIKVPKAGIAGVLFVTIFVLVFLHIV